MRENINNNVRVHATSNYIWNYKCKESEKERWGQVLPKDEGIFTCGLAQNSVERWRQWHKLGKGPYNCNTMTKSKNK